MIYSVTLNPSLDRTLTFNNLTLGTVNRAIATRIDLGGKGINVARALCALGVECRVCGLLGSGSGDAFLEQLQAEGLGCLFVRHAGEVRVNITAVDQERAETTKLNEPGAQVDAAVVDQLQVLLLEQLLPGDAVLLSGSLPVGAPADSYRQLISSFRQRGAICGLDTSGPAFHEGLVAAPEWIKPNLEEAEELLGYPLEDNLGIRRALSELHNRGAAHILLSAGASGLLYSHAGKAWLAQPPQVVVRSTVGAGDAAFAGAFAAWLAGQDGATIARQAAAAGTASAMLEGSQMPSGGQVNSIFNQVYVSSFLYQDFKRG